MDMFRDCSNDIFRVSIGIDRTDDEEIRDFINSREYLENVVIDDLGFKADILYDNIRKITGELAEKGVNVFSIMRKAK